MFWWILLGIWGLGMIWFIFELITAPEMEDHCLRKDVTQEVRSFLVLSERNERHEVFRFVCRNWRLSTGVNPSGP